MSSISCSKNQPPPPPPPGDTTGNVYYVSLNGNDNNPGTYDQPWRNPGYASRQLKPGDTLIILGGTYILRQYDDDIIKPPSGNPNAWITIKGQENNRPILAGREALATAIDLSGVSYVRIENLEITHDPNAQGEAVYFWDGILIVGRPASHIVLKDLYIHHIDGMGMNFQDVEDLQILNCNIEYCGFGAIGGPEGAYGGWKNVRIEKCRLAYSGRYYQGVFDNPENPYDRSDGFGIESSEGLIYIIDTIAEYNKGDGLDSKAERTLISGCIVANNTCDGVKLWGDGSRIENTLIYGRRYGDPTPAPWAAIVISSVSRSNARFEIVNVTVDDCVGENYLMYFQYPDESDPNTLLPIPVLLRNNIFCGRGPECPIYMGECVTPTIDHNLFYFPNSLWVLQHGENQYTSQDISSLGPGNKYGDPLFENPAILGQVGDYHLRNGSPAIDSGTSEGAPNKDLDKNSRPQGNGYDMGCYER